MGILTDLADLEAAEAQGERVISSLWAGDSFFFRGQLHTIAKPLQQHSDRQSVFVTTTAGKVFMLHGLLMFPSFLSDEHFAAEQADDPEW